MLERALERWFEMEVRKRGGESTKITRRGWPDRLVIPRSGCTFFVELKRPGGKLSKIQAYWYIRLKEDYRQRVFICETKEEVIAVLEQHCS